MVKPGQTEVPLDECLTRLYHFPKGLRKRAPHPDAARHAGFVPFPLPFDSTCHNAFDDISLAEQVEDDDRYDRQHQRSHHGSHINGAVAAF